MATSTEQINDLIGGYTSLKAYFEGARDLIDEKVDALTTSLSVKVFVNENAGLDTATGGEHAPVKTLREALKRVPAGAYGTIVFKTSVTVAEKLATRARGLLFDAYPGVTPAFKSGWHLDADGLQRPGQINFAGSYGSVAWNGVGLHFEERPAGGARADAYTCGVIQSNSLTPPVFAGLFGCAITRDAGADAFLLAAASNSGTLNVSSNVTYSTAMNGYWFAGVSSGTARTATRYNTNLATL